MWVSCHFQLTCVGHGRKGVFSFCNGCMVFWEEVLDSTFYHVLDIYDECDGFSKVVYLVVSVECRIYYGNISMSPVGPLNDTWV
jgi:hypothetical protein